MKCNACGNDNVDGARFCAGCGSTLTIAEAAEKTLVGQTVGGRYHVKRVLGEGGMGVVYEAEQSMGSAMRKVALKTLHAHLSHDPSVSQRFHRECGTVAQLEHPNTIKVYDFGATNDGTLYIAMEFVAGKSLSKLIEEAKTLPGDRVVHIVRQIAGSLDEAHSLGIVHRDLKPDNVVLTHRAGEDDVVKLLDFGIAARTESADAAREQKLTQQGMVLGTPPYMSPEQFTGKALDARSDIYSLGVMTYEMLTGRLPFDADTPWQWATEHMTAKPIPFEATPSSAQIPSSMRAAVLRALSKNRDDRQSTAKQFAEELSGGTVSGSFAQASVQEQPSTGTAAMAAPPVFAGGAGPAKTAAMPAPAPPGSVPGLTAAPHILAPPPSRGNKGLVFGLGGVGVALVIGIIVVATRSKASLPTEAPVETAVVAKTVAPPPATIAPQIDTSGASVPAQTTETPTATAVTAAVLHTAAPVAPTATKAPQPVHTTAPVTRPPPQPAVSGCSGCISAAKSGNYTGAAGALRTCSDPAQKAACTAIIKPRLVGAARSQAFQGNCSSAKSMMAVGAAFGMPASQFGDVTKNCH